MNQKKIAQKGAMELLQQVFRTIELVGIENTITLLNVAGKDLYKESSEEIDYILGKVCEKYDVPKKAIIFGTGRSTNRAHATYVFFFLLRENLNMSLEAIGDLCKVSVSHVSHKLTDIKALDPSNRIDAPKIADIGILDQDIKEFLKKKLNK